MEDRASGSSAIAAIGTAAALPRTKGPPDVSIPVSSTGGTGIRALAVVMVAIATLTVVGCGDAEATRTTIEECTTIGVQEVCRSRPAGWRD
jgi:hypothetical protein